jgi:hypothetical protein
MDFILNILQVVIGIIVAYFIIRRFAGSKEQNLINKFFKYLVALFVGAVAFTAIWMLFMSEPYLVSQTLEQLQANPEIQRTIGKQQGYGYNKNEIKEIKQYPATVNFSLYGSKADMELTVLIDSSANAFEVKKYEVEKVTEK